MAETATQNESSSSIQVSGEDYMPENRREKIPLIPKQQHQSPGYSVLRAKLVSTLAVVLYVMGPVSVTVILSQYLNHRWLHEASLDHNSSDANRNVCYHNNSDPLFKQENEIQARVSTFTMYLSYISSIPAIFACLVFGSYSDVVGRRMLLILPILGAMARVIIIFLIFRFNLDVNYLYLAQGLDGITGSFYGLLIATFSVSADLFSEKNGRIFWIVLLHVLADVTISTASIVSGYLVDSLGFSAAIIFLGIPVVLAFLLTVFLMPETRPISNDPKASGCLVLGKIVKMYTSEGSFRTRMALTMCLVLFFITAFNLLNITSIDTLYQLHEPFCWNATLIGYYGAVRNAAQALLAAVILKITQFSGLISDEKLSMIGCLFKAGGSVLEAFVTSTWPFFMVPLISCPGFLAIGIIRGVMSVLVGPFNQGAMFASVAIVETASNVVSSTVLNQVYASTVDVMPGAVYLVMAGVSVVTFFLYFVFFYFYDDPGKSHNELLVSTPEEDNISQTQNDANPT